MIQRSVLKSACCRPLESIWSQFISSMYLKTWSLWKLQFYIKRFASPEITWPPPSPFKKKSLWGIFYLRIWQCFPHLLILVSTSKKKPGTAGSCWPLKWSRPDTGLVPVCFWVPVGASPEKASEKIKGRLGGREEGRLVCTFSAVVWEQLRWLSALLLVLGADPYGRTALLGALLRWRQ